MIHNIWCLQSNVDFFKVDCMYVELQLLDEKLVQYMKEDITLTWSKVGNIFLWKGENANLVNENLY